MQAFGNVYSNPEGLTTLLAMANITHTELEIVVPGKQSVDTNLLVSAGNAYEERVEDVFKWAREVGIERRAYFQIGMPDESEEDIKMTEEFVEKIQPDIFGVTITCPYPGTNLYLKKYKDVDWSKTDEYINNFWHTKYLTNLELKNWQRHFCERFKGKLSWHNKLLIDEAKNLEVNV